MSLIKYGSLWLTLQNSRYDQATTSPCRLLPHLTLSPAATGVSGSVTDASLMRIATSATLRFTSLLEHAKHRPVREIGRASCREGVSQYVEISGVAVCLIKK